MELFTKLMIAYSLRLVVIAVFMFTMSWKSMFYFSVFVVSLYFLPMFPVQQRRQEKKPLKTKEILSEPYPKTTEDEQSQIFADSVVKLVTYDTEDCPSIHRFKTIMLNSNCVFARKAKLWGSPAWNDELTLEDNIYRLVPMFLKFTIVCSDLKLDAFLVELPGDKYSSSMQGFGDAIYKVLKVLSDNDPASVHCLNKSYIGQRGWVFEFNKITFFITTFAPFYPENHPRYAFGADNCYILFQPELSFAFHDLPPDTPQTNWEKPVTVRDKIRVAFKEAGRPYTNINPPMVEEILRPIKDTDSVYQWWQR